MKAFGADGDVGNWEKDRRRRKIRLDKERQRDKFEKGNRKRRKIREDEDQEDLYDGFGWN